MTFRRWLQLASAVAVGLLMAAAVAWLVIRIGAVLALFAVGFAVAYLLDPALDRLERRGWPRARAVGLVGLLMVVALVLLGLWIVPVVSSEVQQLAANWPRHSEAVYEAFENAEAWVEQRVVERFPGVDGAAYVRGTADRLREWAEARLPGALGMVSAAVVRSFSFLGLLLLTLFISIYFMLVIDVFRRAVYGLMPPEAARDVGDVSREVGVMVGQYVRGQATVAALMWLLVTIWLVVMSSVFGTQYGLVVGIIAGLVYVVPYLGAILTNIVAILVAYVTATHDPVLASVLTFVGVVASNIVCDYVAMPRIVGRSVGLHPLVVVFALLAGYQVLGVVGMIIAAPAAAAIKIVLARWLPVADVEAPPGRPPPLAFDLKGALEMGLRGVKSFARRLEDAAGIGERHEAPPSDQEDVEKHDDTATP